MTSSIRAVIAGVSLVMALTVSGCQTITQNGPDMNLDDARDQMLIHADAITSSVGEGWTDRQRPATFNCSLPEGSGLQWTVEREGTVDGAARAAADAVQQYFAEQGFDVRVRENSVSDIDVFAAHSEGLDIRFGAVDDGFAYLWAESVCVRDG